VPVFLAPRSRRQGVVERIGPDGAIVTPLDGNSLRQAIELLLAENVEAIAVCFLFSFANPVHELMAREKIAEIAPGLAVSLSHEVDPAFREFERTCITAFDAYVKPRIDTYLAELSSDLAAVGIAAPLQIMQSRGGLSSAVTARKRPVRLFLSGPAAGVIGAQVAGEQAGEKNLITFDVGGTSCDIALIQKGRPIIRSTGYIDGFVVRVPMVDVNAIGAGGGSIAWVDDGGGLRVGPQSAGSAPGPACYGRGGTQPTVTDASVVLGYIDPGYFAGGTLKLDAALARQAVAEVAEKLSLPVEQTALGIHRVVNAQMSEGIRLVSVQRGIDPRTFTLVSLGGGGGMHATALARELSMRRILIPKLPGVLAACGLLGAPTEHEVFTAFNRNMLDTAPADLSMEYGKLERTCTELMADDNTAPEDFELLHFADICYVGQSYFIEVPLEISRIEARGGLDDVYRRFRDAHDRIHGHGEEGPARIINLRVVAIARPEGVSLTAYRPSGEGSLKGYRQAVFAGGELLACEVHDRQRLTRTQQLQGPAIVEQSDTTTLIEPGWLATALPDGSLIIEPVAGTAS
jgi:N-methylhydantoinase A/oxoprolinase/acetone carboxylase beta subunit